VQTSVAATPSHCFYRLAPPVFNFVVFSGCDDQGKIFVEGTGTSAPGPVCTCLSLFAGFLSFIVFGLVYPAPYHRTGQ
jgi:hypothetical protein